MDINVHNARLKLGAQHISTESWTYKQILNTVKKPPNPYVRDVSDVAGLAAALSPKAPRLLGFASSIVILANDPSPKNIAMTGIPLLVEDAAVPLAVFGVAQDASDFVANEVVIPVFTPDALQSDKIDDGNGHTVPAPAAFDWQSLQQ